MQPVAVNKLKELAQRLELDPTEWNWSYADFLKLLSATAAPPAKLEVVRFIAQVLAKAQGHPVEGDGSGITVHTNLGDPWIKWLFRAYYADSEYLKAIEVCRNITAHVDNENQLLLIYAHEQAAARSPSLDIALRLLKDAHDLLNRLRTVPSTVPAAEFDHCEGHILLTKARLCRLFGRSDIRVDASRGIEKLRVASSDEPAYLSCYTSSYSDLLMFWDTIEASSTPINAKATTASDLTLVPLEVSFYQALALSNVCMHSQAEEAFRELSTKASSIGGRGQADIDLIAHIELFRIKNQLRQMGISRLESSQIEDLLRRLRNLRGLVLRSSEPARRERDLYLPLLQLLGTLGKPAKLNYLGEAVHFANDFINAIMSCGPTIGIQVAGAMHVVAFSASDLQAATAAIAHLVDNNATVGNPVSTEVASTQNTRLPSVLSKAGVIVLVEPGAFAAQPKRQRDKAAKLPASDILEFAATLYQTRAVVLVHSGSAAPRSTKADIHHAPYCATIAAGGFKDFASIGVALSLAARFLSNGRYVYNLAPCPFSPALRYQTARLPLSKIVEDLLA